MKKAPVLLIIITLLAAAAVWFFVFKEKKKTTAVPVTGGIIVSQHSEPFNQSLQQMMETYYSLTESFVNWDNAAVAKFSTELKTTLENLQMDELKKDSLSYLKAMDGISVVKTEMTRLINFTTLAEKRESLNTFSRSLYDFLKIIRFDIAKVYYQECPMAFNDINPGYWLSSTEAVRNPYLGTKHPKYKSGMLKCGGPKESLNFMAAGDSKE